ncbi:Uncharacterized protein FWK35_00004269 [Aphis craccivora]|uniref:Uncharacterized protein n=1 Tax=Aphis craccivora TaxID=307492 RepID=A0A6G0ZPC8_APHCR|nr:Uncharacterized protein FWK35_00004269 [Aphis craccivora]
MDHAIIQNEITWPCAGLTACRLTIIIVSAHCRNRARTVWAYLLLLWVHARLRCETSKTQLLRHNEVLSSEFLGRHKHTADFNNNI